jgi:hypothetical protein
MDICGTTIAEALTAGDPGDARRKVANEQMRAVLAQEGELDG